MVIWLIGKSGAGKRSVGRALYRKLKAEWPNPVFLDGDALRQAICEDLGYSVDERRISERRSSRLCKLLADQGTHVVCAKLSNVPEIREWNRRHIPEYREVYIRADQSVLEATGRKGLYGRFNRGEIRNVVGMDIPFHKPASPWMTLDNDGRVHFERLADLVLCRLREERRRPVSSGLQPARPTIHLERRLAR